MIRNATIKDVDRLVELGWLMHDESPRFRGFVYLPARVAATIERLIGRDDALALVADVPERGVIGGVLALAVPHFACDFVQASDLALFIHPKNRGSTACARLVKAYRDWALSIDAEPNIGLNTGVHPERTGDLLAALGATQTGTVWTWGANSCASVQG